MRNAGDSRFSRGSVCLSVFLGLVASGCSEPKDGAPLAKVGETLSQSLGAEVEPNSKADSATPIGNDTVLRANLFPVSDQDYYSFVGQAGDRVYAATVPGGGSDTYLSVFSTDGVSVLEEDDDDGWGFGSSIAGLELPATGTYFAHVVTFGGTIRPYDLHFRVQSGTAAAEVEPNDTPPTAQALPVSGWVSGSTSSATDEDFFSMHLNAGDTVFASLDLNPNRDASEWDGRVALGPIGGEFLEQNVVGFDSARSDTLYLTVKTAGTYVLRVASATGFGNYGLSVSVHPGSPSTPICSIYSSADVPVTLASGPGRSLATINVPGNPRIADLDVSIALSHAAATDLDIHLRSPAGNDNLLVADRGNAAFPNWDLTLDDEAAFQIGPFTSLNGYIASPEPTSRLNWFDGENAGGAWTLVLDDDAAGNAGTLSDFRLTICEPPPVTCPGAGSLAPLFSTDFEAGDAGFVHSGTADEWERGTPTLAPISDCNSGTQCWKTDLDGTYNASSSQDLKSPPIDLTTASAPLSLSWAMKYQLDTAADDHAYVRIQEVGGASPRRLWEHLGPRMVASLGNPSVNLAQSAGWGVHTADVSAYAGKTVELIFHLDSNAAATNYAGLAIDDISFSACALCGNGAVEAGEECDDSNTAAGDCCSAACQFEAIGASCADNDLCNGDETCNASGACIAGAAVVCAAKDACHVAGSCAANTGACSDPEAPDGTECSGGSCHAGACELDAGTGGANGTGGAGDPSSGGTATGGTASASGGTASGGTTNGGTASTSGGMATGGTASASGGTANGGTASASGGTTTGGTASASGGATTGGTVSASGGTIAGGTAGASGSTASATGGTASASGGTANGGESNGGESNGGTSKGGTASGGTINAAGASGEAGESGAGGAGGAAGGDGPTGHAGTPSTGGTFGGSNSAGEAGAPSAAGAGAAPTTRLSDVTDSSGCGCAIPGRSERHGLPLGAALALGLLATRRRHRRARKGALTPVAPE